MEALTPCQVAVALKPSGNHNLPNDRPNLGSPKVPPLPAKNIKSRESREINFSFNSNTKQNTEDTTRRHREKKKREEKENMENLIHVNSHHERKRNQRKNKKHRVIARSSKIDIALITDTNYQKMKTSALEDWNSYHGKSSTEYCGQQQYRRTWRLWIEVECRPQNVSIGVVHDPQENEKIEKVRQIYNAQAIQIKQKSMSNEVILARHFNAKLKVNYPHAKQWI